MSKLVIVGLDGVGLNLIERLIEKKKIPNIEQIINKGFLKPLESTSPPLTIPSWPCMISGKNPGEINLFSSHSKQGYCAVDKLQKDYIPFWEKLDIKIGLLNVPGVYPSQINGFIIPETSTSKAIANSTHPKELKEEFKKEIKDFKTALIWKDEKELLKQAVNSTSLHFKIINTLYSRYQPEIFMFVETNTDLIQHHLMKYFDETHPLYKNNPHEKKIYDYFEHLDYLLGEFFKKLEKDTNVLIVSDHGQKSLHGNICLNKWLTDKGYLTLKNKKITGLLSPLMKKWFNTEVIEKILRKLKIKKITYKLLLGSGIGKFISNGQGISWASAVSCGIIDFKNTKAFSAICPGFIYINGENEEQGIVKSEDYERIKEEIVNGLKKLKVPGINLEVKTREEIYRGKYLDNAPDILVFDKDFNYWPINHVNCQNFIRPIDESFFRVGDHHSTGIIAGSNKSLEKEKFNVEEVHSIVMDLFKDKRKS